MATAPSLPPVARARAACAAGAIVVSGTLAAGLLALFYQATPPRWLAPTPDLMARAAACQDLPGRAERLHCTQAVVAAHRDRLAGDGDTVVAGSR